MDTSVADASITSRKRKRNEEDLLELEETTFIVLSVVTMLLGVMAWYHNKYFVKSRIKLWRGWYGIVNDILSQSVFDWDGTKYMITVENENAWNEYVKSHEEAKRFRFKAIPNWDDIVDICAKDRANGIGSKHALDADDVMSKEANEEEEDCNVNIGLEESSSATKKKGELTRANKSRDKYGIVNSMREVAESLKEFVQVTKKKMEGNAQEMVQEVLNELKLILDLDNARRYKAIAWLSKNPDELAILKALPLSEKKDFILTFIS